MDKKILVISFFFLRFKKKKIVESLVHHSGMSIAQYGRITGP